MLPEVGGASWRIAAQQEITFIFQWSVWKRLQAGVEKEKSGKGVRKARFD